MKQELGRAPTQNLRGGLALNRLSPPSLRSSKPLSHQRSGRMAGGWGGGGGGRHVGGRGGLLRQAGVSPPLGLELLPSPPPLGRNYGGPGRGRRAHSCRIPPPPFPTPLAASCSCRILRSPCPFWCSGAGGGPPLGNLTARKAVGLRVRSSERRGRPTTWALSLERSGDFRLQGASVEETLASKEEQESCLDFWRPALRLITSAGKERRKRLVQISGGCCEEGQCRGQLQRAIRNIGVVVDWAVNGRRRLESRDQETGQPAVCYRAVIPLEQGKEGKLIAPHQCRSTSSGNSGGVGTAADHHPLQVCTHPGTIHPPPAWLCFCCTLSVILAEVVFEKEAD
ncbi:uncharacterized protein LOC131400328 [Diceros bicornis minor]|uniref:uncharacterized protein LOC131400328 n=1 Tax=Diceros bicornis minor TaxID=77932 RepID=UPI0026EF2862|nr:uncharacterized protein LOC131400328 [Diceros bicornis minor]